MNDLELSRDPVEALAEEFLERKRRGERPTLEEYVGRHPELAADIRDLFPALVTMEKLKPAVDSSQSVSPKAAIVVEESLRQLGDFRIIRQVGRGGMGVVYEAEQVSLGRHVALKVLPRHLLADSKVKQRFEREARAAARLHHTNIVPVFGVGEHEGTHYYAMQFIQGLALDDVLAELQRMSRDVRGSSLPSGEIRISKRTDITAAEVAQSLMAGSFRPAVPDPAATPSKLVAATEASGQTSAASPGESIASPGSQSMWSSSSARLPSGSSSASTRRGQHAYWHSVAQIGVQVAQALAYAHEQGVLHRDVKPSNLLLDLRGTVWITDFGLAKDDDARNLTEQGDILGTLRYMAPERLSGKGDVRADLYSLGLTLYELLTLRPAFDASDRGQLIKQVMHGEPVQPRKINPAVPHDLETVVLKAIARDAAHRYQAPAELAEDLQRFIEDRPVRGRRARLPERMWRLCRRNPLEAGLLGVVALLLLVVASGATVAALWLAHERGKAVANQVRAEGAEKEALELWKSYLAQLQISRQGAQAGHRFKSLDLLSKVAAERPSLELRNEAIWFLAQADLRIVKQWNGAPSPSNGAVVDYEVARYAREEENGDISIRRIDDDQELMRLRGSGIGAVAFTFSPDGRRLAVKYHRNDQLRFCVWNLERQQPVPEITNQVHDVAFGFSPDSRIVAAGQRDGSFRFHEVDSGAETSRWPADPSFVPYHLAYRPGGRQLAVSSLRAPQVRICDADTGKVVRVLPHPKFVRGVAWHPDGKYLATACDNWHVYVWQIETGRRIADLAGHRAVATWVTFSKQGDLLVSTGWDGTTRVWSPWTSKLLVSATGDSNPQFGPDDRLLAVGRDGQRLWLWEVAPARERRVLHGHFAQGSVQVSDADVSPDGRLVASAGVDGFRLWDTRVGKEIAHIPRYFTSNAFFHPSGKLLITSGRAGREIWPIERKAQEEGDEITIGPPQVFRLPGTGDIGEADLSRDGRILAVAMGASEVQVFDVQERKEKARISSHRGLAYLAVSPDGKLVATGTWQATGVKVWDADSGKLLQDLPVNTTAIVNFSPDGRDLVTSTGQEYCFWDCATWQPRLRIPREGAGNLPGNAAFSPDGTMVAIVHNRTMVRLLDPSTGSELATLPTSGGPYRFSPDGSQLISLGENLTLDLWDLRLIRRQLAAMNLDWDTPPYRPAEPPEHKGPLAVTVLASE